mmetsp:Transcript_8807/g.40053  ORF Transcript_8807/g.40053 Transcript_8807/m.40053 type:complete len:217 (-) Transcript_8807:873-1523(-)
MSSWVWTFTGAPSRRTRCRGWCARMSTWRRRRAWGVRRRCRRTPWLCSWSGDECTDEGADAKRYRRYSSLWSSTSTRTCPRATRSHSSTSQSRRAATSTSSSPSKTAEASNASASHARTSKKTPASSRTSRRREANRGTRSRTTTARASRSSRSCPNPTFERAGKSPPTEPRCEGSCGTSTWATGTYRKGPCDATSTCRYGPWDANGSGPRLRSRT